MFSFSFDKSEPPLEPASNHPSSIPQHSPQTSEETTPRHLSPSRFHALPPPSLSNHQHDIVPIANSHILLRKAIAAVPSHLSPNGADILPTIYEGGFKLWECAIDLTEFLQVIPSSFTGKSVLELGAGHALPSIMAARTGATCVHVHDYNVEVLEQVTIPNVAANVTAHENIFAYYSGSWNGLPKVLGRTYDVVLSSDTVYAEEQTDALAKCVLDVLAPGGMALIAGKAYYFGLGGGTHAFARRVRQLCDATHISLQVHVAKEIRDGVSNVREILNLSRA